MSKYARAVAVGNQMRMYDVVDLDSDAYKPRPSWGADDQAFLSRLYAPNKDAWVAAGQWFVQVCEGVQDSAVHAGTDFMDPDSYLNPDGSNGDGVFPEEGG